MSTFQHKALLPIVPGAPTAFTITSSSNEVLGSGSETFGELFVGKMVSIDTDAGTAYLRATYDGTDPATAVTTDWAIASGTKQDFFVPSARMRLECISSEASTNLRVWVTSQ